jgi:uncharacterized protein
MIFQKLRSHAWRVILNVIRSLAVLGALVVLTQDFQVFPLLVTRFSGARLDPPPADIEALTPLSADGQPVLVWRLRAPGSRPRVALLFHGNGETVASFQGVQRWLATLGITTYSMEFRGYNGTGSGWPSERGLYEDGQAAFELMTREEGIEPKDAIVLGSSLGTGIASHIAARYEAGALVLFSPYTSLPEVVALKGVIGMLAPLVWHEFPSLRNMSTLRSTCVISAHGRRDSLIPFHHSERLRDAYRGDGTFTLLESQEAGHNDIIGAVQHFIPGAIQECFQRQPKA